MNRTNKEHINDLQIIGHIIKDYDMNKKLKKKLINTILCCISFYEAEENDKYAALQKENQMLRAMLNAPDINYPNTEGGKDAPETPINFPDEY